jgi:hypothetical protein
MSQFSRTYLVCSAQRELLDPGTNAANFEAAAAVLNVSRDALTDLIAQDSPSFDAAILALSPDRMERLAAMQRTTTDPPRPELVRALAEALGACRPRAVGHATVLPLRRAHSLFALMEALGVAEHADAADVVWLFENDEYPVLLGLDAWCLARARTHGPLPEEVARVIRDIRDDEPDSPPLDRLAAWASPCKRGMLDLASWENGYRRCLAPEPWKDAVERWKRGEANLDAGDGVLRDAIDSSANAEALRLAHAHHPEATRRAMDECYADAAEYPAVQMLMKVWSKALGGAS